MIFHRCAIQFLFILIAVNCSPRHSLKGDYNENPNKNARQFLGNVVISHHDDDSRYNRSG